MANEQGLARALGWFSIGLGVPQLVVPREFAQMIGASGDEDSQAVLRLVGLREIGAGMGILLRPRPAGWLWARVAGDMMDLALLGRALSSATVPQRWNRLAAATMAIAGVTVLDLRAAVGLRRQRNAAAGAAGEGRAINVKKTITVNRSTEEVYQFWHDFQNLPRFMSHLESVQVTGDGRSHWKAKAPAKASVEWDAKVVEDRPNELIAWQSLDGAAVPNAGSVRFAPAPGNRGTEVSVELQYDPPGGRLGAIVARLFGEEPEQQIRDDLRAFKQVMETGEVVLSDASIHQRPHAARPAEKQGRR